jgi:beta-galactosidase
MNGYRTSHNEPTPELLNACDQLGMLVLDENRRMGTNAEPLSELSRQIRRDRNHPSVFMWSLANEEWNLQSTSTGASIMQVMQNLVHSMDSTRLCTAAMNGRGAVLASVRCWTSTASIINWDNRIRSTPGNPTGPSSARKLGAGHDRGIYTNDAVNGYVWGYDIENSAVGWGEPAEVWWPILLLPVRGLPAGSPGRALIIAASRRPTAGPASTRISASWTPAVFRRTISIITRPTGRSNPCCTFFPHWNWTPGQPINIWAFGNCQAVELFTNGVSLGRQTLNVQGHVEWDNVPYAPGTLQAIGYNNGVAVITNTVVTTGVPAAIALIPDRSTILADGRDVSVVTVAVLDSQGRVVPTATNEINFSISAGGTILGVGNGNPSSHEADKGSNQRAVFNGLAEVIVQSISNPVQSP